MTTPSILICSGVGLLGAMLYAHGRRPLLKAIRALTLLRAAGYLAASMAEGAWDRRSRWREMRERAERER